MADPLPPLGGLSVNAPPSVRDLPLEITDVVLANYLAKLEVGELCEANLLQICMLLRGTNQCNDPDDPLWKAACARLGLTERLVGGLPGAPATPTWHVTFLAMCKEVAMLTPYDRATYKGLLRGDDAYTDGPFSGDDDSGDDDPDEEATTERLLRRDVVQFWWHAAERDLFCMMHYMLRRVHGLFVHVDNGRALNVASEDGHLAIVELLLAHGADVHAKNQEDETALEFASENGHAAVVEVLLAHGADVHADTDRALIAASQNGNVAVVEVLLAHGADVHADDDEALRWASRNDHLAVVEVLLAHGADVHADFDDGGAALVVASRGGHLAVVEVLLAHGANVHAVNDAALRFASSNGHAAVVQALLAAGATGVN